MNAERPPEKTDLSNCDLEPIHIPASIQPHGLLMVLREPDLTITQISKNVDEYFGRSVERVLEQPLSSLLGATEFEKIRAAVTNGQWDIAQGFLKGLVADPSDGRVFRGNGGAAHSYYSYCPAGRNNFCEARPVEAATDRLCRYVVSEVQELNCELDNRTHGFD
jgi:PAS fold